MENRGTKWDKVERRWHCRRSMVKEMLELMFFMGQFYHNLDEKGRLIIPAAFRDRLNADGSILMQGFDQNLLLITNTHFEKLSEKVNQLSLTDRRARLLRRKIFSTAQPAQIDKSGRILLAGYLRTHAGVDNEAVVVGAGHYVEIWSRKLWEIQSEQLENVEELANIFEGLDLSID